jgi:coniferyl-aldehyde dehydrogenase
MMPPTRLQELHRRQSDAFAQQPYPPLAARRQGLIALRAALRRHQDALAAAMASDFGGRPVFESKFVDVLGPILLINHALKHLPRWARTGRRATELLFAMNSAAVMYQPKGVVGIIAPWNFPVYLSLGPLILAVAAGNRAMIKMSELSPATTAAVAAMLAEVYSEEEVAVVGGPAEIGAAFAALPFDHLVFTGSPAVGAMVMRAAAEHLTPVTLELGGKSPAIVAPGADLHTAAERIVHGKCFNAGQTCVAPDYALVPRAAVDAFAREALATFGRLYPGVAGGADFASIASARHLARLQELLADAVAKGATVAAAASTADDRRLPLHVVTDINAEMRLSREEIFGPVLPVIGYDTLADALAYVAARPRPLAIYPFGFSAEELAAALKFTHAGGVTVDDWGWHVFNHDLPFGGIGTSGAGSTHGEEGFRALSHAKPILTRHRWFPAKLFYPPYRGWIQRLVVRLYLG